MKCKVINSSKKNLEYDINEWLESGKYNIVQVLQTEENTTGYITLTIFYQDLKETRKSKLEKIKS
jgi:hypothetical protein